MLLFKKLEIMAAGCRRCNFTSLALRPMFLVLLVMISFLPSCGFSPMYAKQDNNAEVISRLASVDIKPIKTLMGQAYVNALEDALNPSRVSVSKDYILEADLSKSTLPLAIEQDRTVTRYKVVVVANYSLREISSGKIISSGFVKGQADFDKVDSDYATFVSENESTNRTIRELARDTKLRIIAALLK